MTLTIVKITISYTTTPGYYFASMNNITGGLDVPLTTRTLNATPMMAFVVEAQQAAASSGTTLVIEDRTGDLSGQH